MLLTDAAVFPRDKTCGDGLTPRAIGELERLGLGDWLRAHTVNHGLRAHGFGQTLLLPWPGGTLPDWGSAVARTELDDHLRTTAIKAGARALDGVRAVDVRRDGGRVSAVVFTRGDETLEVGCRRLVVADGVRSPLGKVLGREWHRDTVYGVAGRSYVTSTMCRRPLDQLPPRAARRAERGALRLRLDLPARLHDRCRRGQPRRRHARHREAPGRPPGHAG